MKNQFIITVAFIAITGFTSQLFAQDAASKTAGYDLKKGTKLRCVVTNSEAGLSLNFTKIKIEYSDARKQGSGQLNYFVSSVDNSLTEVASPRDAASGLATGKRQSKPMAVDGAIAREASAPSVSEITVTKTLDDGALSREASTPSVSEISSSSVSGSGTGAGKANFQDLHFVVKSAGKTISSGTCVDGTCDISTDLPDGDYTMVCSWSWGSSNSGSMASGSGMSSGKSTGKRCSVDFLLQIENGACMAINEKGLPGEKKPKK